ncbi:MAG TPA: asparagine synthase-related protein [Solirubrobacterales bacterium]|nr:asparagine synthase-related protein [Solirubrobacterales bacterium]
MTRLLAGATGPAAEARLQALATAAGESFAVERLSERLSVLASARPDTLREGQGRPRCLFDGTLFNADELASELGLTPAGSEEELLDTAYRRYGKEMPGRLRGNFVLLAHDPADDRLLLACDQLGARSVFFRSDGGNLSFATEVHHLLRLLPSRPAPDEPALVQWLAATSVPEGRTLYRGVERLGGGQVLERNRGTIAVRRYWKPRFAEPAPLSRADAAESARAAMTKAVRGQLPGGERCGVLLSGGLDSSSVAALGQGASRGASSLRAYSAVFPDHPSIDESELIEASATELGLERTSVAVHGGSMIRGSLEYLQRWELPLPAPNHFLWQPLLERAAADGTSCMLDGEGGDELWRFSPYLLADLLMSGRARTGLRTAREMLGEEFSRSGRSAAPYLRVYGLKGAIPPSAHRALRRLHPAQRYAPSWFSQRSAEILFRHQDPWAWKRLEGPRWWAYLADLLTGFRERLGVGDYLRHRAEMAGLQARHPLIDVDLVEFALGLPPSLAIDPRLERPVMREAIEGLVPDSIRLRPGKSYFTALFNDCLAERDFALIRRLLTEKPEIGAYVDLSTVRSELLDDRPGGIRGSAWPWSVWRLVTAECWLRAQRDGGLPERLLADCSSGRNDWALSSSDA